MFATPHPMNTFKCPSYIRQPKTEAELIELGLTSAARELADELVENHPDVIRAAAAAEAWAVRLKRLTEYPAKSSVILNLATGIDAELETARENYRFACLDSFLAGDHEFTSAIEAGEGIAMLERRLHAAKTASADLNRRGSQLDELRGFRDRADAHLANTRFELKRAVLAEGSL